MFIVLIIWINNKMDLNSTDRMNTSMYSVKYCGIVDGTMGILSRKVKYADNSQFKNQINIKPTQM